ncbi:RRP15-like protein isoform X2 [Manis javanica]|uniref:RRP15-like protein isoform X2 n=1 Tax=Manis javanica TaxID=9974 RepID=UPI003C6DAFFC
MTKCLRYTGRNSQGTLPAREHGRPCGRLTSPVRSCGSEEDHFSSSDEAVEADNEDENAAGAAVGTNVGWADAMAKVLSKKTPKSKSTILVKNKELEKEKEKLKQERLEKRKQRDKKREWEMMCRVKPDVVKDKETERNLQRIATRGVVQLFNAVQKHQKNVDEKVKEAGGSIRKRAKLVSTVSKKDFISVLRGMDGSTNEKSSTGKNSKAKQKKQGCLMNGRVTYPDREGEEAAHTSGIPWVSHPFLWMCSSTWKLIQFKISFLKTSKEVR